MTIIAQQLSLVQYGDIFWDLFPVLAYVPGTEIPCIIYVANPTDTDRVYMISAALIRDGETLVEYPIRVDNVTEFPVEANSVISLPGSLVMAFSDCALTLNLYEKEQNEVVDSVSAALTSTGTAGLPDVPTPGLPGLPPVYDVPGDTGNIISSMVEIMIMMMVMMMMMKMMTKVTGAIK